VTKSAAYGARLAFGDVNKAFTVAAATNLLTIATHGYSASDPILIKSAGFVSGTPLVVKKVYYARDILTNTFALSLTPGGAAIDVTVDGSGSVTKLSDIAQISSLSGPNMQAETIDVTTHDSPSAIREFVSGLIDAGEMTVGLVFDPNVVTQKAIFDDLVARTQAMGFGFFFPTLLAVTWGFEGIVTGFGPIEAQPDGAVTATCTIKLTGVINVA